MALKNNENMHVNEINALVTISVKYLISLLTS